MTDGSAAKAAAEGPKDTASPFSSIALLLQGGGALGSYQAGVYQALSERGIEPTWLAGISIGSVNSAIIAGNAPSERVSKLRSFWEGVTAPLPGLLSWPKMLTEPAALRGLINQMAASRVLLNGVPGFFKPRFPPPVFGIGNTAATTSLYETHDFRSTLERLIDFDRINARERRLSVGAVNVRTGNFAYFDNATDQIGPEHIMASCALPPSFSAVEIAGEFYWDGGMVSNTPLEWVLSARSNLDTLIFQVDLWSAKGELPQDLPSVAVRMKEIQYSSRTRAATDRFRSQQEMRAAFYALFQRLPENLKKTPEARILIEASDPAAYNIVQLIYRSPTYEAESKDYEFSRRTMEDHWRSGYEDAQVTLARPEVLRLPGGPSGVAVYDILRSRHEEADVAQHVEDRA